MKEDCIETMKDLSESDLRELIDLRNEEAKQAHEAFKTSIDNWLEANKELSRRLTAARDAARRSQ